MSIWKCIFEVFFPPQYLMISINLEFRGNNFKVDISRKSLPEDVMCLIFY